MAPCRSIPPPRRRVAVPDGTAPTLLAQVHTEEEFDWHAEFDRRATATAALEHLPRLQAVFERHGLAPTYAVDWPVITSPAAGRVFGPWVAEGRAEIGAHLHPWVNPPHEEQVNRRNSFAGNLPPELERAKLARLVEAIEAAVGERPRTFVAGRYGIGPNTPGLLVEQGFWVDGSATPPFDFRAEGGPDFSRFPTWPYWHEEAAQLLGLPVSGGFVGLARRAGRQLFPLFQTSAARAARVEAVSSRLGLLERIRLSPEGFRLRDLERLTRQMLDRGERVFSLSLHSTSVLAGANPYVATERDVELILERLDRFLGWFGREMGGEFASHRQIARRFRAGGAAPGGAEAPEADDRPPAGLRSGGARQAQLESRADLGGDQPQIPTQLPGESAG